MLSSMLRASELLSSLTFLLKKPKHSFVASHGVIPWGNFNAQFLAEV